MTVTRPQDTTNRIYLDYAAATPMDKRVYAAMEPFYTDMFHNPSALYEGAITVKNELKEARQQVAGLLGARPAEIIFTAGGTESANLAIKGVMDAHPDGELIVSSIEHEAVLRPSEPYSSKLAPVDHSGIVDMQALQQLITDRVVLISVMLVNNEVGSVQPIQKITKLVQQIRKTRSKNGNKTPLYVHTDACQAPMYIDCHTARLGVDLMTLNGGKIHGPKQSGILYKRAGVTLSPQVVGGGQEWGYRSGTENVAYAVGFATALRLVSRGRPKRQDEARELRDWFMERLESRFGAVITGHRTRRVANNIHVIFTGVDNERMLFALDEAGIDASAGSACSASSDTSSHVLRAMGYSDNDARSSIRMTIGRGTSKEQLQTTLEHISRAIKA